MCTICSNFLTSNGKAQKVKVKPTYIVVEKDGGSSSSSGMMYSSTTKWQRKPHIHDRIPSNLHRLYTIDNTRRSLHFEKLVLLISACHLKTIVLCSSVCYIETNYRKEEQFSIQTRQPKKIILF